MCNGWANHKTWTVVSLLQNDEQLYNATLRYQRYLRVSNRKGSYRDFIGWSGLASDKSWLSKKVNHEELDAFILDET